MDRATLSYTAHDSQAGGPGGMGEIGECVNAIASSAPSFPQNFIPLKIELRHCWVCGQMIWPSGIDCGSVPRDTPVRRKVGLCELHTKFSFYKK